MIADRINERGSLSTLREVLELVHDEIEQTLRWYSKWNWSLYIVGALAVAIVGGVWGFAVAFTTAMVLIVVGVFLTLDVKPAQFAKARIEQVAELLDALDEDAHPAKDIVLKLNLATCDREENEVWSGRGRLSRARKAKYVEVWLRLQCVMADRSRLRVQVKTKAKTKSGSIQTSVDRLKLSLRLSSLYGKRKSWPKQKTLGGFGMAGHALKAQEGVGDELAGEVMSRLERLYGALKRQPTVTGGGR